MNKVSPKSLLHSKWTKVNITNKEKHFAIIQVDYDEEQRVEQCIIQAVINNNEYAINWRDLKDPKQWKLGWK
ncbi:MAG: TIGR02450 family Trp-rich protein [Psychrobium sp.]